jgi:hypothetical protein
VGRDENNMAQVAKDVPFRTITIADLPPADVKRWVPQRKAEVVAAVRGGVLTLDAACQRYALTVEEYLSWESAISSYGLEGLRITEIQHHRQHH